VLAGHPRCLRGPPGSDSIGAPTAARGGAGGTYTAGVFQHHAEALGAEDIDAIVDDYADDAIFITPDGVLRGKDGVREAFEKLTSEVPGAEWELPTQIYEDDILLLEWKATSANAKVEDGIDTFVFREGQIRVQTVRYTLQRT
jgi:hypothetical protein